MAIFKGDDTSHRTLNKNGIQSVRFKFPCPKSYYPALREVGRKRAILSVEFFPNDEVGH